MSLYCMRCINQTKIHVPNIALTNANIALPHIVASGASISARRIPNCADEIVVWLLVKQIYSCTTAAL